MTKLEQINLFKKEFDISISVESINLDIYEDDGYGNSHLKGSLELNNYTTIIFDVRRLDREVIEPFVSVYGKQIDFFDENSDTRGDGIRDENNIFISYMNHVMKSYHRSKPFMLNKPIVKKSWWGF
jgi:hypothetical protein